MRPNRRTRPLLVWSAALVLAAGCGGGSGSGDAGGATALGVDLAYADEASPRAAGLAQTLAADDQGRARNSVSSAPPDTWLRISVGGSDFAPIVCQFPKREGGRCDGIPSGTGRTVAVEEWDQAFETLFYRGRAIGVRVVAGGDTRVAVSMRPPVAVRRPASDTAVNVRQVSVQVQAEPRSQIQLYMGPHPVGPLTLADDTGIAALTLDDAGPDAPPAPAGSVGLADGDYLLSAVAYPPGAPLTRHLGAPVSFAVDLRPPLLEVSAPSMTGETEVDLRGVTEPGASVRCSADEGELRRAEVDADGRFGLTGVPLGPSKTKVACTSTDRAGNATPKALTVVHRDSGFAVEAALPDITNQLTHTMRVRATQAVEEIHVEVGGQTEVRTPVIVQNLAGSDSFAIPVELHPNQWNQVKVSALVAGETLGETVLAVEHDDVAPVAPEHAWMLVDPPAGEWTGDRLIFNAIRIGLKSLEPAGKVDVLECAGPDGKCETLTFVDGQASGPNVVVVTVPSEQGYFDVPAGRCYAALWDRAWDRAANGSKLGLAVLLSALAPKVCVR